MGEAKRRRHTDRAILDSHKFCCFCGATATEVDHVPPRCFFDSAVAPHGYVFPACTKCNRLTRLDEQALGVILPMTIHEPEAENAARTRRLIMGTRNNNLELVREWSSIGGAAAQKRILRDMFGRGGDVLRHAGYGAIAVGPTTYQSLDRFALKFGHALFYKHVGRRLVGSVEYLMVEIGGAHDEILSGFLKMAIEVPEVSRNGHSLTNRFDYRFNYSVELGILLVVAYFGGQHTFVVLAGEPTPMMQIATDVTPGIGETPWRGLDSNYFQLIENTIGRSIT